MSQSSQTQIGDVIVYNAYAYESLEGVTTGSCFMAFRNASNDSDWVSQTTPSGSQPFSMAMPMTFAIDGNGTWSMITLTPDDGRYFQVAPGVPTVLKPGYAHIMLMDLSEPLVAGQTIELKLGFESGSSGTVQIQVVPFPS